MRILPGRNLRQKKL